MLKNTLKEGKIKMQLKWNKKCAAGEIFFWTSDDRDLKWPFSNFKWPFSVLKWPFWSPNHLKKTLGATIGRYLSVIFAPKALLSDVTDLSFLRRRRQYLTLPICHFAPKALLSDVTYLSFLRRRRHYPMLPICYFCAEDATIGRYLSVIFNIPRSGGSFF